MLTFAPMRPLLMIFLLLHLGACNSSYKEQMTSENDVDAARNFIRSSLDGKWDEAKKMLLPVPQNIQLLERIEDRYKSQPREETRGYRDASITIYDTRTVNDSVSVVTYANSFKNKKDSLRVVRVNGKWLVDFQYSFDAKP